MIRRSVGTIRPPAPRRLRLQRRRWPLLVVLVPVAWWGAARLLDDSTPTEALEPTESSVAASSSDRPESTLVTFDAPIGTRLTGARCWMIMIDQSSSMSSSDEAGTRAAAVRAAADFLAAYGLTDDRIGVTWFADAADVTAPGTALASASPTASTVDLGSGTKISTALTATLDAMESGCGGAQRVVVLVSDGEASSAGEFAATAGILAGSGRNVNVHLIAMNGNRAFEPSRSFWEDLALGIDSIRVIDSFGRDEVAGAVADILTLETGQQIEAR